jgi:CheY-like chemotaxis protein
MYEATLPLSNRVLGGCLVAPIRCGLTDSQGPFKEVILSEEGAFHIFVVDDERAIAETLATILGKSGFVATSFTNPLEALETATMKSPGLLLSDVVMPVLSGVDLAVQIKEKCPNCKILLFSGQAETTDLLTAARNQGHNFPLVAKPIHPADLILRIRELISTEFAGDP